MSPKAIAWIERLVWIFIYLGCLAFVLGLFVVRQGIDEQMGQSFGAALMLGGALGAAVGVLLIWLRSRLKAD